jgi:hypothetical protein
MAKWEIRFQRFAISFRPSALDVCGFRFPLAFGLQPLAFADALVADFRAMPKGNPFPTDINTTILGTDQFTFTKLTVFV